MTRLEIRNMVRKRLGETTTAFWSDTELNGWIDDAGVDLAFRSKSIKANTTITTVASTSSYALSTYLPNLLSVLDVYYKQGGSSGTWIKIDPLPNREEMDQEYPGWMNTSAGVPFRYFYDKEEDNLELYPKPDATNAGAYCRVYYARTYTALASDTTEPTFPEPLHLAMVDFVVALGYETRGYGDKSNDARDKYLRRIQDYKVERLREKEDDEIVMKGYRCL